MPDLEPIRRKPLYVEVADRLREFIAVQDLRPGDRLLSERELARRLGVSRTSVRQALTALRVAGLVDIRHGDGVFLRHAPEEARPQELGEAELSEIMEVREALETQTARLSARRRSQSDLAEMRGAVRAMASAIEQGEDGAAGDRRFHAALVKAAGNSLLARLVEQLTTPIERTRHAALSGAVEVSRLIAGHRRTVDAIGRRDESAAAEAMRAHLGHVLAETMRGRSE
jgi:GntR family transcriptional regulator, transcriptional repressor for pyruvate dehydrogenase complex